MPNGSADPVWSELGKIDYLLDHLARAVERGELPRESYDRLAPRYLERRGELTAVLAIRNRPGPSATPAAPTAVVPRQPGQAPTPAPMPERPPVSRSAPPPPASAPRSAPAPAGYRSAPAPYRAPGPLEVNWTGVLTALGSLLVIVAAAIFAIATWDRFSVEFKIVFLGALTAGFYVAGALVRTRLDLKPGGVALTAVGSAMLLFDGWIVIDGYGLDGPWPWVAWLAVCSAIYWYTETRIAGRFFGVIGASAQIAWVWLLGQGLGWTVGPRMAAIALIGLAWVFAGEAEKDHEPTASLAEVLRFAGPLAIAFAVLGVVWDLGPYPAGWIEVISALVVATAATVVCEARTLHSGIAALAHLPVLAAIVSMTVYSGAEWWHVGLLLLMTAGYLIHEQVRGGWGHGVLAAVTQVLMWLLIVDKLELREDAAVLVFALVATAWIVGSWILPKVRKGVGGFTRNIEIVMMASGYVVLSAATVVMPFVGSGPPLVGTTILLRDVLLPAIMTGLWLSVTLARRDVGAGVPVLLGLFYTTAAVMAWSAPGWHSALYASGLSAAAGVILIAHVPIGRRLALPAEGIAIVMRVLTLAIVPIALLASEAFFDLRAWELSFFFGVTTAVWLVDSLVPRGTRYSPAPAAVSLVLAVGTGVWSYVDTDPAVKFALAACAVGTVIALSGLLARGRTGWSDAWPLAGAVSCSIAAMSAAGQMDMFAVTLALCVVAWIATAWMLAPELVGAGALFAIGSVVALLTHLDPSGWVVVTVLLAVGGVMLAPSTMLSGSPRSWWRRAIPALAAVGWAAIAVVLVWDIPATVGLLDNRTAVVGDQGVVAALVGLAAYCVVAGLAYRAEVLHFIGGFVLVAAAWAELSALDISGIEAYTTALAAYLAWVGYRLGRTDSAAPREAIDVATALVALAPATIAAVVVGPAVDAWPHLLWALGLALLAVALGVLTKVRAYFFGGVMSLAFVAVGRSWTYLVEFWWLVLGVTGIMMLVVALTWERQQGLVKTASGRVADTFRGWR